MCFLGFFDKNLVQNEFLDYKILFFGHTSNWILKLD